MAWTLYRNFAGAVVGARIRVPISAGVGVACYGGSMNPIHLRVGAIGLITDILPEGARRPGYVKFAGALDYTFAAEVLVRKADNSPLVWRDFHGLWSVSDTEDRVVITRRVLDRLEVEYQA